MEPRGSTARHARVHSRRTAAQQPRLLMGRPHAPLHAALACRGADGHNGRRDGHTEGHTTAKGARRGANMVGHSLAADICAHILDVQMDRYRARDNTHGACHDDNNGGVFLQGLSPAAQRNQGPAGRRHGDGKAGHSLHHVGHNGKRSRDAAARAAQRRGRPRHSGTI